MSDTPTLQINSTVLILLAIVAVLLAAIAGILVFNGGSDQALEAGPESMATQQTNTSTGEQAGTAPSTAEFDPATATQVPEGVDPQTYAETYYESVLVGDFETAYAMQPAAKQTGTVEDFAAQLQGYGITDYQVTGSQDLGEQYVVVVDQMTAQFGTFENQWTFANVDGVWYVQDKAVTGMK